MLYTIRIEILNSYGIYSINYHTSRHPLLFEELVERLALIVFNWPFECPALKAGEADELTLGSPSFI